MKKDRLDVYISSKVKSKAKFFALQHKVSMSTLVEDALVQLISHNELADEDFVNYEYFTFDYPAGGFVNNDKVPFFNIGDKQIKEFYGDLKDDKNK